MFGEENEDGRSREDPGNSELLDMSKHLGEVERGHDVDGDTLEGEVVDEVSHTKGVTHGEEAKSSGTAGSRLVIGIECVEIHSTNAIRDLVVMRYLDTFGDAGLAHN